MPTATATCTECGETEDFEFGAHPDMQTCDECNEFHCESCFVDCAFCEERLCPERKSDLKIFIGDVCKSCAKDIRKAARKLPKIFRKAKWLRMARTAKTKEFMEWYCAPDNYGGRISKRRIERCTEEVVTKRQRIE